ncbi:MAG: phosphoribosylanthranilate isomerase, partial [Deltaproteobacteria bacterium]|nr:phosphoribosylanthranilate isomerase [Deltaproteobacteria bacterium]
SAYLVECAGGPLPGGNAMIWDWSAANSLARTVPIVLAGGLNAENVSRAIEQAAPDAVDVSSGVESAPGSKDMGKVRDFLQVIRLHPVSRNIKRVFD